MDAYGAKIFLDALSEIIKGASAPSILPVWQREILSARSPPSITCTHPEYDDDQMESRIAWESMEDKLIQRSFFFGNKEMEAIRDQVSRNCTSSKFELLVAFLWRCRTIALDLRPEAIVYLTQVVNIRGKSLNFELPLGYCGNAFVAPAVVSKAGLLCSNPLTYAVEVVKKVKEHMNEEYVRSTIDLVVIKGRPRVTNSWNFIVSDNRYVGFDEVDLGWGKPIFGGVPIAISNVSFGVSSKNNKGEKGILIAISLPPVAMEKFQELYNLISTNVKQANTISKS